MTRRLRPPVPVRVRCHPDGSPAAVQRNGRHRTVTHVASTWVHPALWWEEPDPSGQGGPYGERTYYRVVIEGLQILEVFSADGGWYLERIVD